MSLQITILKVLSSHADGRSSLASLNHDIAILAKSGREWTDRVRRLASRASSLDLFGSGYIIRDHAGWQITGDGREFLRRWNPARRTRGSRATWFTDSLPVSFHGSDLR